MSEQRSRSGKSSRESRNWRVLLTTCMALIILVAGSCRAFVPEPPVDGPAPRRQSAPKQAADSTDGADDSDDDAPPVIAQPMAVPPSRLGRGQDSVVAPPGQTYEASAIQRLIMGDLNRNAWNISFKAPILDLDSVGGGLKPVELTGGRQTLGLEFEGNDGLAYQFRSVIKDASRALPPAIRSTPLDDAIQDQMAAQFPLAAAIVAEFLEAADVLVARPRLVIMPDDPRLGEFRELFAGRMGWIEPRPNERENDARGFAGSRHIVATDRLFEILIEDPAAQVNVREFVRARLIDMFVNDWDRHADNWRWAGFEEGECERFDPIPRDRDWAFARIDGLIPLIAGIYYPEYVSFEETYPSIGRLMRVGAALDRRLLGGVGREIFTDEAQQLQHVFTDSVIDRAVSTLPPEYLEHEGQRLRDALRARRDSLDDVTAEYYRGLARWVDVYGTRESDSVAIRAFDDSVNISLLRGGARLAAFSRTFHPSETGEIRVYLENGRDVITLEGSNRLPIRVRLVGDLREMTIVNGDSTIRSFSEAGIPGYPNVSLHVRGAESRRGSSQDDADRTRPEPTEDPIDPVVLARDRRDWGHQWLASPTVDYQSNFGPQVGLKVTRYGFGFRQLPYESRFDADVLIGTGKFRVKSLVSYEHRIGLDGLVVNTSAELYTSRTSRYYGIGNETSNRGGDDSFTGFRPYVGLDASLGVVPPNAPWSAWIGPRFVYRGSLEVGETALLVDAEDAYGRHAYSELGVHAGAQLDTRDDPDEPGSGVVAGIEARAFPGILDLRAPYAGLRAVATTYRSIPLPLEPVLHLRVHGEHLFGEPPYPDMAMVGGRQSLPGYRSQRFIGDASLSLSSLLRFQAVHLSAAKGLDIGGFGIASAGRVWADDVANGGGLHYGVGGGVYTRLGALGRTLFLAMVHGENDLRFYAGFGLPF